MDPLLVLVVGFPIAGFLAGRHARHRQVVDALAFKLGAVHDEIRSLRAAYDHHIDVLSRRLRGVEAAAASSERESRMVSLQLVDHTKALNEHVQAVDRTRHQLANAWRDAWSRDRGS
jgi:hypothetical protein